MPSHCPSSTCRESGVAIVATVPQVLFEALADEAGTSRDLIDLLTAIQPDSPLAAEDAQSLLLALKQRAWIGSSVSTHPAYVRSPLADFLATTFLVLRNCAGEGEKASTGFADCADIAAAMDDLGWRGLYSVLGAIFDPTAGPASPLWLPEEDPKQSIMEFIDFLRLDGSERVQASTIPEVPHDLTDWPPPFEDDVTHLQLGRHALVVARARDLRSMTLRSQWRSMWEQALARTDESYPPLGVISWQSVMGPGFFTVGVRGQRESELSDLLCNARKVFDSDQVGEGTSST